MNRSVIFFIASCALIPTLTSCSAGPVKEGASHHGAVEGPDLCEVVSDRNRYFGRGVDPNGGIYNRLQALRTFYP